MAYRLFVLGVVILVFAAVSAGSWWYFKGE